MKLLLPVLGMLLTLGLRAECQLETPNQLLAHVKKNHPKIIAEKAQTKVFKKGIKKASQSPNPKVELNSKTPENDFGSEGTIIGGNFKHVFELGDKRKARIDLGQSQLRQQKIRAQNEKELAIQEVIKTLNKLHHLNQLIPLYTESIHSFKEVLRRLDKLPSKSPKETVEKSTLELVLEDYKIRKSKHAGNKEKLLSHLTYFIDDQCTLAPSLFASEANLRALPSSPSKSLNEATEYLLSKNRIEIQKGKLAVEKSRAWSNLEVGPTVEYNDPGFNPSQEVFKVGLAFEFNLPLFHTNEGGKAQALKKLRAQEIRFKNNKKKLRLELERQKQNYKSYRKKLKDLQGRKEIKQKHQKIEDLFSRGTISTGLIIEIHRQLTNWHHNKFHFQQLALDALWRIYELTGQTERASY